MIQDIAPHRLGNQYNPAALPEAGDYVLFFDGGKVLLTENSLPKVKDFPAGSPFTYLFTLDSSRFFRAAGDVPLPQGEFADVRALRGSDRFPREMMFAILTGSTCPTGTGTTGSAAGAARP